MVATEKQIACSVNKFIEDRQMRLSANKGKRDSDKRGPIREEKGLKCGEQIDKIFSIGLVPVSFPN